MKHGILPGILCLVSSRRYPGQFTDTKEEEALTDPTIYVYDKCTWDVKPSAYGKERFQVFIGDEFRKPKVLTKKDFRELDEEDRENLSGISRSKSRKNSTKTSSKRCAKLPGFQRWPGSRLS